MILVTGGTGLVGSHLLRNLVKHGHSPIRAIKRKSNSLKLVEDISEQIEWIDVDVTDARGLYEAMKGVKQVYHSAAVISFVPSQAKAMKKINVEGTSNVVNMAMGRGVEKLLHVSSIAALGRSETTSRVDENSKWENSKLNTNYAMSKYLSEKEVWRAAAEGLNVVVVNPSAILGTGNWYSGSGRMISRIWEGLKYYPTGGTGFIDVKDLVNIMVQLMNSNISNERYVINADNLSYKTYFEMLAKKMGVKAPSTQATPFLGALAWRLEAIKCFFTGRSPLITRESVLLSSRRFYYDNSKIEKALNYQFRPIAETIDEVAGAFLKEVNNKSA